MARGHGGSRPGAGRKPKSLESRAMDGGASHGRPKVVQHPSSPAEPAAPVLPQLDESDCPNELTHEERQVWLELAPHATKKGTLTDATSLGFRMLCGQVALERAYRASVMDRGSARHVTLQKDIRAALKDFMLQPFGKPDAETARQPAVVDPIKARFFGGR